MSNESEEPATSHLQEVEDGAGCTEIWERISEIRDESAADEHAEADDHAEMEGNLEQ